MLYYIIRFLTCLFAVYGAFTLITCILEAIGSRSAAGASKVKVVVAVRDVEEQIENIVRNAVRAELPSRLMSDGRLIFVDMDSRDGTLPLLHKLEKDYGNIDILEIGDRQTAFADFGSPGQERS